MNRDVETDRSDAADESARRWERLAAQQAREGLPQLDVARSWRRIETRPGLQPAATALPWWRAWSRYLASYGLGAATAAVLTWMVVAPAPESTPMTPLGAPAPTADAARPVVAVVFREQAQAHAIREALRAAGAEVVGGPSALGVWRVALSVDNAEDARRRLARDPAVESVSEAP